MLTPRQHQVLEATSRGLTHQQIADELGIGVQTVKTHAKEMRWRLGVTTGWQAVAMAYKKRLL